MFNGHCVLALPRRPIERPASIQPDVGWAGTEGQEHAGQTWAILDDVRRDLAQFLASGFRLSLPFGDRNGGLRSFLAWIEQARETEHPLIGRNPPKDASTVPPAPDAAQG